MMFVYAIRGGGYIKIGVTDDLDKRLKGFNGGALPFPVEPICFAQAEMRIAMQIEGSILSDLPGRALGEWASGETSDAEIIRMFEAGHHVWTSPVVVAPDADAVRIASAKARDSAAAKVRRLAADALSGVQPKADDWHKLATAAVENSDKTMLRRIKTAHKSKRMRAQNKAAAAR